MLIAGFDPGTKKCGYAILNIEGSQISYVECGVITARQKDPVIERERQISEGIASVLDEFKPLFAAVEAQFVGKWPGAALRVAEAKALVVAECNARRIPIREIAHATAKLQVSGKGNAAKHFVAAAVKRRLGLNKEPSADAADACAVTITLANKLRAEGRAA